MLNTNKFAPPYVSVAVVLFIATACAQAQSADWVVPRLYGTLEKFAFRSSCSSGEGTALWTIEVRNDEFPTFAIMGEKHKYLGKVESGRQATFVVPGQNCKKQPEVTAVSHEQDDDLGDVSYVYEYKSGKAKAHFHDKNDVSLAAVLLGTAAQTMAQMQADNAVTQASVQQAAQQAAAQQAAAQEAAAQQAAAQRAAAQQIAAAQQAAAQQAAARQAAAQRAAAQQTAAAQQAAAQQAAANQRAAAQAAVQQAASARSQSSANACLEGPACGSSRPAAKPSDASVSQNYVDNGLSCRNGVTLAHYQLSNNSYYNLSMTVTLSYQTGGVEYSFTTTQTIAPRSANDYSQQIPCTDQTSLSDYGGRSHIDRWQFY